MVTTIYRKYSKGFHFRESSTHKINNKDILPRELGFLTSQDIFPEKYKPVEFIDDNVEDGIFQCRKCGSRKTTYYSLQTRLT